MPDRGDRGGERASAYRRPTGVSRAFDGCLAESFLGFRDRAGAAVNDQRRTSH